MWDAVEENPLAFALASILLPLVVALLLLIRKSGKNKENTRSAPDHQDAKAQSGEGSNLKKDNKASHKKGGFQGGGGKKKAAAEAAAAAAEIDRLAALVLKGFAELVEDCSSSPDGGTIAAVSGDRSIRLFAVPDQDGKSSSSSSATARTWTISCGRNRATKVAFVSETVVCAATEGPIHDGLVAFQVSRNDRGSTMLWEIDDIFSAGSNISTSRIISLQAGGGVVIACSEGTTVAVIQGSTGTVLSRIDSNCLRNSMAATGVKSGKVLGVAGFTSDVKLWHMPGSNAGGKSEDSQAKKGHSHAKQASRLGQLAGHKSRVSTISFSSDETRAVTSSKDGTARVWKLDVRWDVGEDPRTLVEIPTGLSEGYDLAVYIQMEKEYQSSQRGGEESAVIVGTRSGNVDIIEACKSAGIMRKRQITAHSGAITALQSYRTGCFLTAGADKRVRVWDALELLRGS